MKKYSNILRALVVAVVLAPASPCGAVDAARGRELFQTCAACHNNSPTAVGPSLNGIVGRKAASVGDFRYSNQMKRSNLLWDSENLRLFVTNPQKLVPGNRMPFAGVQNETDVDDIVAYLSQLK